MGRRYPRCGAGMHVVWDRVTEHGITVRVALARCPSCGHEEVEYTWWTGRGAPGHQTTLDQFTGAV